MTGSATKQSSFLSLGAPKELDCFASLAMTDARHGRILDSEWPGGQKSATANDVIE
jgi:hypothetical protein